MYQCDINIVILILLVIFINKYVINIKIEWLKKHILIGHVNKPSNFPVSGISLLLKPVTTSPSGRGLISSSLTQNLTSTSPNLRPCTLRRDEKETRHYCFHKLFLDDAPFSRLSCYFKTSEYNYFSKKRLSFWHFKKMDAHINYGPALSLSTSSSFIYLFIFTAANIFIHLKSPPHPVSSPRRFL